MSKVELLDVKPELFENFLKYGIRTREELYKFVKIFFGIDIPREQICPHHRAPFDFFADAFFEKHKMIMALANRSGGKTFLIAILNFMVSMFKGNCEITHAGAVQEQADICLGYMDDFMKDPLFHQMIKQRQKIPKRFTFMNGSSVRVITASTEGFNGPHPIKASYDEVELMDFDLLQEAFSMTKSKNHLKSQDIFLSTRKYASGTMNKLIKESKNFGIKIYAWCIWEVLERCPDEYECKSCPAFKRCKGQAKKCAGYYPINDFIQKAQTLSDAAWKAQWLCEKPSSEGLFYEEFDKSINMITTKQFRRYYDIKKPYRVPELLIPKEWRKICVMDFGYNDPTAWIGMAMDPMTGIVYVFKEFYERNIPPSDLPLAFMGLPIQKVQRTEDWSKIDWEAIVCDHSNAHISEFKKNHLFMNKGLYGRMVPALKDRDFGYKIVREYLHYDYGLKSSKLKFFSDCINGIEEHEQLHYPRSRVVKEYPDASCEDHIVDDVRYGLMYFERKKYLQQTRGKRSTLVI